VAPEKLAELIKAQTSGRINMPTAKDVLKEMLASGKDAESIIKAKGLEQISDEGALDDIVADVIDNHPEEVAKYLAGKEKLLQFLMGQVMKASKGKANPGKVTELLKTALEARRT
jgi:aspartyl-tRNA(Asn)/glutamyl-tRNA(Gln) amidotransferase subunit B